MYDFNTGARRRVNKDARAKLDSAQALVQRTLAQHGLGATPSAMPAADGASPFGFTLPAMQGLSGAAPSALAIPEGARFDSHTQTGKSGSRAYRAYVPASAADGATGLVMMLHGCTQTPEDFAAGTGMNALADRHGFVVLYPEQSRGANAQTCWNWFSPNDQRRDRGEPEILASIARTEMTRHKVAPQRCFVAGLSAGGAMAVILGETYPDVFAAVGAHSALPFGAARDVASAFAAMAGQAQSGAAATGAAASGTRTIVFHGTADAIVHPSNGAAIARDLERNGPARAVQTPHSGHIGGRAYSADVLSDDTGRVHLEDWRIEGLGHAWSGGQPDGSYTDAKGPDASAKMVRFFFEHKD